MKKIAEQDTLLLDLLAELSPGSSKTTLRSWLAEGRVLIGGKSIKRGDTLVLKGKEVALGKRALFAEEGIKILYEDNHLVVIEKPEGLLSVSTVFDKQHNAHTILKQRFHSQRVYPVHRLDRETSGVMVFAYSELARDGLKEQFHRHSIEREYHALVEGHFETGQGTWKSFLKEDIVYKVSSHPTEGQWAITHYQVVNKSKRLTTLRLTLETGRKNQIRVHCHDAGHPIFGDKKYGSQIEGAPRLCLHASKLSFIHPETGKKLTFLSPLPNCFNS
jgi:23S rRNA pseudouridine1911/1915/1917 synthase